MDDQQEYKEEYEYEYDYDEEDQEVTGGAQEVNHEHAS